MYVKNRLGLKPVCAVAFALSAMWGVTAVAAPLVWGSGVWGQDTWTYATTDWDGDGVVNGEDAFPYDATEWLDTDGDSIGNNTDPDDDNDDLPDVMDPLPLQAKFNLNANYKGSNVKDSSNLQ